MSINIQVKFGRDTINLTTTDSRPLGDVRRALAEKTHLPVDSFKLVSAGAIMKDDSAPLSAYGVTDKSVIALIGGNTEAPTERMRAPERKTEQMTIDIILTELHKVNSVLVPGIDYFLGAVNSPEPTFTSKLPVDKEYTRLAELLLQALLRIDSVPVESEWENARKHRKAAVRDVQGVLDRLEAHKR